MTWFRTCFDHGQHSSISDCVVNVKRLNIISLWSQSRHPKTSSEARGNWSSYTLRQSCRHIEKFATRIIRASEPTYCLVYFISCSRLASAPIVMSRVEGFYNSLVPSWKYIYWFVDAWILFIHFMHTYIVYIKSHYSFWAPTKFMYDFYGSEENFVREKLLMASNTLCLFRLLHSHNLCAQNRKTIISCVSYVNRSIAKPTHTAHMYCARSFM